MNRALCVALIGVVSVVAGVATAECLHYGDFPRVTATAVGATPTEMIHFHASYAVGVQHGDLVVFELGTPAVEIARVTADEYVVLEEPAIVGSLVYCLANSGDYWVIDLQDPASPIVLGTASIPGLVVALGGGGDLLGAITGNTSWALYDCTDPLAPEQLSVTTESHNVRDLVVMDGRVLVEGYGWSLYDITDPVLPAQLGNEDYDYFYSTTYEYGTRVVEAALASDRLTMLSDDYVRTGDFVHGDIYYTHEFSLRTLDVSDPAAPVVTGEAALGTSHAWPVFLVTALDVAGDLAAVFASSLHVELHDLTTADLPVAAALDAGPFQGGALLGSGQALVSGADATAAFTFAEPLHDNVWPVVLPGADEDRYTYDVIAGDDFVAVWETLALSAQSIQIFQPDVSLVQPVSSVSLGAATGVATAGHRLYAADSTVLRMCVLDPPQSPGAWQIVPVGAPVLKVACSAHGFVAVGRTSGVDLYDLLDPDAPVLMGTWPGVAAHALEWSGRWLYAVTDDGFEFADVSDPASPVPMTGVALPGLKWIRDGGLDVAVVGGADLVAVVDVAAPAASLRARTDFPGPVRGACADGNVVYVGNGSVSVLDASDLAMVGQLVPSRPVGPLVAWQDGVIGAGMDVFGGLTMIPLACEATTAVPGDALPHAVSLTAAPNPFNPRTEVRFILARAQSATVTVYDLRGRAVRTLASGAWPQGEHRVAWDGRDDTGHVVGTGTYLLRLRTAEASKTVKITLVK